jgi:hypothetical protein
MACLSVDTNRMSWSSLLRTCTSCINLPPSLTLSRIAMSLHHVMLGIWPIKASWLSSDVVGEASGERRAFRQKLGGGRSPWEMEGPEPCSIQRATVSTPVLEVPQKPMESDGFPWALSIRQFPIRTDPRFALLNAYSFDDRPSAGLNRKASQGFRHGSGGHQQVEAESRRWRTIN